MPDGPPRHPFLPLTELTNFESETDSDLVTNFGYTYGLRKGRQERKKQAAQLAGVGSVVGALSLKYVGSAASSAWDSFPSRKELGTTYFPSLREALQTQYEDQPAPLSGKKVTKAETLNEPKKVVAVQSVAQPSYTPAYSGGGRTYSGGGDSTPWALLVAAGVVLVLSQRR